MGADRHSWRFPQGAQKRLLRQILRERAVAARHAIEVAQQRIVMPLDQRI